jgi:hypothetical protein
MSSTLPYASLPAEGAPTFYWWITSRFVDHVGNLWIPNPLWTHFGLIETPLVGGGVVGGLNQAFAPKIRQSACGWSAKSCLRWLNGAAGTLPRLGSWVCWWHIRLAIWNASFHHFIAGGTWLFLNLKRCQESGGPKSHRVWYFMFWHKEYLFNRTQIWAEVKIWQQIVSYTSASVFLAQSLILMHDSIMTTISFSLAYASTN